MRRPGNPRSLKTARQPPVNFFSPSSVKPGDWQYRMHSVQIAVQQIPRLHRQSPDPDRLAELHHVDVRVAHRHMLREEMETHLPHFLQIAHAAVRHRPHAPSAL